MKNPFARLFHVRQPIPPRRPAPTRDEIAAACHVPLRTYIERENPAAILLAYTPRMRYRAAVLHQGHLYRVCHDALRFCFDEEELPGWVAADADLTTLACWVPDPGESWFDDLPAAENAALTLLAQLEEDGDSGVFEYVADEAPGTRFTFGPYELAVDVARTAECHAGALTVGQRCGCPDCRNYEKAAKAFPQALSSFFDSLGLDPAKPAEVFSNADDPADKTYYGFYHLCGRLLHGDPEYLSHQHAVTEDFSVSFQTEHIALLEDGFPYPVVQMEVTAFIPWTL